MITRVAIIILLWLCKAQASDSPDSFYVWQQNWSKPVVEAVINEKATTLYPLASVIQQDGDSALINIPWSKLSSSNHRYVPVFRVPLAAFQRADLIEALTLTTKQLQQQMSPIVLEEIQFDLDCPERLLERYVELVKTYRTFYPDLRLSITALPSHLKHDAFLRLAQSTDYYVLQVHGIEVPKHIGDKVQLLNMKVAQKAIQRAENIGSPYTIALPCYAYELNFDAETGKFLFLTAEKTTRRTDTIRQRSAARNADLAALYQSVKTLDYAKGIIWFRLPVTTDRLCLPRSALAKIQSGAPLKNKVECNIVRINDTALELELINRNTIAFHQAIIKLEWPQTRGMYDLFHTIEAEPSRLGELPTCLYVPVPPPGKSTRIGWFHADPNHHPSIGITLK